MKRIYLDYNATTPVAPSVTEAMQPFFETHFGNPSSPHSMGRAAAEALEDARMRVASMLGASREDVIFTGGGTESNNLAIVGTMTAGGPIGEGHLVVSAIEHPSVLAPAKYLESLGYDVTYVDCDHRGVVQPDAIASALRPGTRLVSVMHAHNVVGTIQPIAQIVEACRQHPTLVHADAAQSVGKIPVGIDLLGVDLLTLAGHKIYAPKGIGALYVREGIPIRSLSHGAPQEFSLRPGTENVPYAVALGQACKLAAGVDQAARDQLSFLRDRMTDRLIDGIGSELLIYGRDGERLPNTLAFSLPRVSSADVLRRIPELCVSTGAACHGDLATLSPMLRSLGVSVAQAAGGLRISVGWSTSEEDIDRAASLLLDAWESTAG